MPFPFLGIDNKFFHEIPAFKSFVSIYFIPCHLKNVVKPDHCLGLRPPIAIGIHMASTRNRNKFVFHAGKLKVRMQNHTLRILHNRIFVAMPMMQSRLPNTPAPDAVWLLFSAAAKTFANSIFFSPCCFISPRPGGTSFCPS